MKTHKLLATSLTRQGILKLVNQYFYSDSWVLNDNGELYNEKLNKVSTDHSVEFEGGKYKFYVLLSK